MTTKNLLIQLNIKPEKSIEANRKTPTMFSYVPNLYEYSQIQAKEYAKKCGADYHCITTFEYDSELPIAYQKFAPFSNRHKEIIDYSQYDQIVYCDSDFIWLTPIAPNIFNLMESSEHIFFASPEPQHLHSAIALKERFNLSKEYLYFNSGLFGIKTQAMLPLADKLRESCNTRKGFHDQGALNLVIAKEIGQYGALSQNWNWFLNKQAPLFSHHYMVHHKGHFTVAKVEKAIQKKQLRIQNEPINLTDPIHLWFHPNYTKKNTYEPST